MKRDFRRRVCLNFIHSHNPAKLMKQNRRGEKPDSSRGYRVFEKKNEDRQIRQMPNFATIAMPCGLVTAILKYP